MSVYKKLQKARIKLQNTELKKSGRNKFAGYEYFELSDFLPAIQSICDEMGLCGVISYTTDMAFLNIYDVETEGCIVFSSPMSRAELKGCHDVQNLGAVQTYLRRYLWTNAFEIVEHDALDATTGSVEPPKAAPKPAPKAEAKAEPIVGKAGEWQIKAPAKPEGDTAEWLAVISKAVELALSAAGSEDDIMALFKRNKELFNTVKEVDAVFFKEMMDKFTAVKNKFKEQ